MSPTPLTKTWYGFSAIRKPLSVTKLFTVLYFPVCSSTSIPGGRGTPI